MTKNLIAPALLLLALTGCNGGEKKGGGGKPDNQSKQDKASKGGGKSSDSKGGGESSGSAKGGGKSGGQSGGSGGQSGGQTGGTDAASQQDGSPTADTVKIPRDDQGKAGIQVAAVTVRPMARTLSVAGQVMMDEKHTDHIGAIADGRIERVFVLPGDRVRAGQVLATLHSHSVHETVGALTQAFADLRRQDSAVTFAVSARDRYTKLYGLQAASLEEQQRSDQQLAQAQRDRTSAEAMVRQEREHLGDLLRVNPDSLQPNNLLQHELIPIKAVAAGVVITRSVSPGQVVNTGDETFVTSNLSTVWVAAAVNEQDLRHIKIGASAKVTTQGDTTSGLNGRVGMLGDLVDPQTRTLPVRVIVPNPAIRLRPGMFATAAINEPDTRNAIFVPTNSLQDVNGFRVVFVTADGLTFRARAVKTGTETQGMTEITDGLQPNDHVVTDGAFMVKGELLKGTVGEG